MALTLSLDTEISRIYAHYKNDILTIQHLHESNEKPREILRELTQATDTLVIRILLEFLQRILKRDDLPKNMLLLAQGGYGRRELHPKSDVDILFLYTERLDESQGELVKKVFQTLFDLGFQVGHCCRSYKDALEVASSDHQSQTAMSESRFLAGDWRLFETFKHDLWRKLTRNRSDAIRFKIGERSDRRSQFGTSINISEPNIKESPGGLRDYHFGIWIGSLHAGRTMNLTYLKRSHYIDDLLMHKVQTALDFHWRLRNDLHFLTGKEQDVLAMPLQHEVSLRLGYKDQRGRLAEEEMMREYYANALTLCQFADHMIQRCEPLRFWKFFRLKPRRNLSDGFTLLDGKLYIPQDLHYFEHNPQRLLMAFIHCAEQKAALAPETAEAIHDNLDLVDQAFLHDKLNAALMREFFAIPRHVEPAIQEMRRTGVLERLLPEWRGIAYLVRYDLVHRFTVDEHSLLCLYHLENLHEDNMSGAKERHTIWLECRDKDMLRMAVLFHDIGKGRNGDHSTVGARLADDIARRMRMPDKKREQLVFLVQNHLIMSHTAQRRDLSDPQVCADFSDIIQNLDMLNMLYLLTYVDMRSVSPEAMTEWKNNLLWQLYLASRDSFVSEAAADPRDPHHFVSRKEKILAALTPEFPGELVQSHLDSLPPSYLVNHSTEQISRHLRAIQSFDGKKPSVQFYPCVDPGCMEFELVWFDKVGLFNKICTAVMLENFSIVEARLNTRSDGIVANNIVIRDALSEDKAVSQARQRLLQERIERVLLSKDAPPKLPRQPGAPVLGRNRFETKVKVLNDISPRFTIIEIRCADRRGLLQNLTSVLYDMDLSIHFARIITEGNRVTDVFYITDAAGNKLDNEESIAQLKKDLQAQLEPMMQHV